MSNLLSLNFWFNLRPDTLMPIYQKIFIGFVIFLAICSLVSWFISSKKRNLYTFFWHKIYSFSLMNFFVGLILLFFSHELIPFLSARFWFLLWGLGIAVWLVFIFKALAAIPKKKKQIEKEREYKKYIP